MDNSAGLPDYYALIACIHGITGLVIFFTGLLQFALKKGGRMHRIIGRIYLYSWISILATGAFIGSPVIVAIVLMGFYLTITGIRAAIIRNRANTLADKAIVTIAAIVVLLILIAAIYALINRNYPISIIAGFFALLYGIVISGDIRTYIFNRKRAKYGRMDWYVNHLTRMQFSFVTAVSAFIAVQNVFGNTVLNFILPSLIGFVVIRFSTNYFVKKLKLKPESNPDPTFQAS